MSSWTFIAPQPTTAGLPICRPTTAACEVIPPVAVKTPWAALIPWISSGDVSSRTRITFLPWLAQTTASLAVKTTWPVAAPGEAASPLARTVCFFFSSWSNTGWSNWFKASGSTLSKASSIVVNFSSTRSTAILTAAIPVLLAFLVCSIYSLPSWIVNSKSWTSP